MPADPFDDDALEHDAVKGFIKGDAVQPRRSSSVGSTGSIAKRGVPVPRIGASSKQVEKGTFARRSSTAKLVDPETGKRSSVSSDLVQVNAAEEGSGMKTKELSAVVESPDEPSTPTGSGTADTKQATANAVAKAAPVRRQSSSAVPVSRVLGRKGRPSGTAVSMAIRQGSGAPDTPVANASPTPDQFARRSESGPSGSLAFTRPSLAGGQRRESAGVLPKRSESRA